MTNKTGTEKTGGSISRRSYSAENMYIISALHEIPVLSKRIAKQKEDLRKYSSGISTWVPEFGSAEAQKKEVEKLVQSTLDLIERQRWLKRCVAFTNSVSKIEIDGYTYSVTELLAIKAEARAGDSGSDPSRDMVCSVYDCLNDSAGKAKLAQYNGSGGRKNDGDGSACTVVQYFDETRKQARYNKWYEFVTKITSELEIFNARTKLLDPEDYQIVKKE